MSREFVHKTVMTVEALDALKPMAGGRYADGTVGGGGHAAAAGARIPGRPMSVQRRVIAAVKKAVNRAK